MSTFGSQFSIIPGFPASIEFNGTLIKTLHFALLVASLMAFAVTLGVVYPEVPPLHHHNPVRHETECNISHWNSYDWVAIR